MLALVFGVMFGGVLGYLAATAIGAAQPPAAEPWLRSVITCHAMHSRETVASVGAALRPGEPGAR